MLIFNKDTIIEMFPDELKLNSTSFKFESC